MPQDKVFVTRLIPQAGLEKLRGACRLEIWPDPMPPACEALLEKVRGIHGILCLLTDRIDRAVMDAAGPQLRAISTYAVGFDNIDVVEATQRGIPVGHTPGVLTEACADLTFALLMAAARRVVEGDRQVRAGLWRTWEPLGWLGADVHEAVLGLVGFGRIGQAVAKRAGGFGMHALFHDPFYTGYQHEALRAQPVELDMLLAQSDFVSLHAPLTPVTRHLINRESIAKMKVGSILINTARGGLLDQDALVDGLSRRHLAAAALDVTDPEPMPEGHPLLRLDNVIITPHIASASTTARGRMAVLATDNLIAGLQGRRMPHCANPQVYENKR